MGIGKVFTGISIVVGWIIVKFMLLENVDFLKLFISSPTERASFLNSFHVVEPAIWILVILVGIGIIFWGIRE